MEELLQNTRRLGDAGDTIATINRMHVLALQKGDNEVVEAIDRALDKKTGVKR